MLIELALIKLTKPQMEPSLDSILQRLDELEDRMDEGVPVNVEMMQQMAAQMGTQGAAGTMMQPAAGAEAAQAPQQVAIPKAQLEDLNLIRQDWGKLSGNRADLSGQAFAIRCWNPAATAACVLYFLTVTTMPSEAVRRFSGHWRSMWRSSTARPCILKRACARRRAFKHHLRQ